MVLKICTLPSRDKSLVCHEFNTLEIFFRSVTEVSIVGQLTVMTMMTA